MSPTLCAALGVTLALLSMPDPSVANSRDAGDSTRASGSLTSADSARARAARFEQGRAGAMFAATATSSTDAELAASWQPPWNPPHALYRRRTWERVVLFPQRLATYPLSWMGAGIDRLLLYGEQSAIASRLSYATRAVPGRLGFAVLPASLGDRTGLGLRFQARSTLLGGPLKNAITVEHSATTLDYHRTRVAAFGNPFALEYAYDWRPEERFYGLGMGAGLAQRSDYAAQVEQLRGSLQFGWNRRGTPPAPHASLTMWAGPRAMVTRTGREPGVASFEQQFPELAATRLNQGVEHFVYGARLSVDWRQGEPHWTEGWRLLAQSERFDRPIEWLALRDARGEGAQFTRTVLEYERGFSFMRAPRTIRVLGRVVDVGVTSGVDRMALRDLSTLGGAEGLGGFTPGRFHDLDALLTRVTYVFPLVTKVEMALQADAGGVYGNVWRDPRLSDLATSYGAFVRPRGNARIYGWFGVERSRESLRFRWKFGGNE
jgi:hypothetical protein